MAPCGLLPHRRRATLFAVRQFDHPIGEKKQKRSHDEFWNAENEIAQSRSGIGIILCRRQDILEKIIKTTPDVIQSIKDDDQSDRPDYDPKNIGRFHISTKETGGRFLCQATGALGSIRIWVDARRSSFSRGHGRFEPFGKWRKESGEAGSPSGPSKRERASQRVRRTDEGLGGKTI